MSRFICLHGHFYQPPRENPWTDEIELQPSATPYHDWNQRITAECYRPNSRALVADREGRVLRVVNNYGHISFNFGPTLLAWLERSEPETYRRIIETDAETVRRFSGHGAAVAQCYNHIIMPLANLRDKRTQVIWGVRDFEHRFQRRPEGMWLPETAADLETLDLMAEQGIRFTILAPHQGRTADNAPQFALRAPHAIRLPSGRTIAVFFYDAAIAGEVAFGGMLNSGELLARRLDAACGSGSEPQLISVATDGETFGHHHRGGEATLADCIRRIDSRLTVFGEFLERFPPTREAFLNENTSWSCAHGVERWRSDCGDNSGAHPGWNQRWRSPLRDALDWLRDRLAGFYEMRMAEFIRDPWAARDGHIGIMLRPEPDDIRGFLIRHAGADLPEADRAQTLKLLQLQRMAMLMFTSDAWFFDDISGIETIQNLSYAARAIELAKELGSEPLEPGLLEILAQAQSNIPAQGTGADIYRRLTASG